MAMKNNAANGAEQEAMNRIKNQPAGQENEGTCDME